MTSCHFHFAGHGLILCGRPVVRFPLAGGELDPGGVAGACVNLKQRAHDRAGLSWRPLIDTFPVPLSWPLWHMLSSATRLDWKPLQQSKRWLVAICSEARVRLAPLHQLRHSCDGALDESGSTKRETSAATRRLWQSQVRQSATGGRIGGPRASGVSRGETAPAAKICPAVGWQPTDEYGVGTARAMAGGLICTQGPG